MFARVDKRAEGARTHARASRVLDEDVADDAVVAAGEPQDLGAALGRGGDSVRVDRSHGWILELVRGWTLSKQLVLSQRFVPDNEKPLMGCINAMHLRCRHGKPPM